jgi:peptidoglycan-N-acetylglucosamine deacetylase
MSPVLTHFSADLENNSKNIYLTFDDGPDPRSTAAVLNILDRYKAKASFFVITQKAKSNLSLIREIKSASHSVGDHSLDHRYRYFFQGRQALLKWIAASTKTLNEMLGENNIGFRPPAGIRTPELHWALRKLDISLIYWKIRFFDAVFPWSPARAEASLKRTCSGDIILLHDAQPENRLSRFLKTLSIYIEKAMAMGFKFQPIMRK